MWQLVNRTPYAAERCFVRDRRGAEVWVVAVKATFRLLPTGTTERAELQDEVLAAPEYRSPTAHSSLVYESDLVIKPGTDVVLNGSAHAPDGAPLPYIDVGLSIGERMKTLRVFGERKWARTLGKLVLSRPEPFVTKPITYENAFGGLEPLDERNPSGSGYALDPEQMADQRAACIENPQQLVRNWKDRPDPAGFGVIGRNWSPRRQLAGTYDLNWRLNRAPLPPLDLDERFYLCAPADQQFPRHLRGGEAIALFNLVPGRSVLRFALPRIVLGFETRLAGELIRHHADLSTVVIEPDAFRLLMVWCTWIPCHGREHKLEKTVIYEKKILSWAEKRRG